jgi:hypothetical protein
MYQAPRSFFEILQLDTKRHAPRGDAPPKLDVLHRLLQQRPKPFLNNSRRLPRQPTPLLEQRHLPLVVLQHT